MKKERKYLRKISLLLSIFVFCAATVMMSATVVKAATKYEINGASVAYYSYSSSPSECWRYANNLYNKIWGQRFTNSFGDDDNYLKNLSDSELTLNEEHLKLYVSGAELGSVLRICNAKYLHGSDGWGHSQIIVQKDSEGFTVLEGGLSAYPYCREKYYTWEEYCNARSLGQRYAYIKYIKWPGANALTEDAIYRMTHEHTYILTSVVSATCEEDGMRVYTCSCGQSYTELLRVAGHTFGEWKLRPVVSAHTDSIMESTCIVCGKCVSKSQDSFHDFFENRA